MADQQPLEVSSSSDVSGGSSQSAVELNIKTLDSQIFSFEADKNMAVSAFKEKIATQIGVPIGQQRLIFRGKVLKDDHPLSEYNVENGDTLHLVERQPQPSPGSGTGESMASNDNRGQEYPAGGPRNRIGQITHSVVLGTLNVGEPGPGEAVVPDLSRVIGAVLNSIGIGNLAGGIQPGVQASHGNETEGSQVNAGSQSQAGNQSAPMQAVPGQFAPLGMQIPQGAAIAIPSLNMPIPDSLNTLTEFMNRMEQAFSQNGYQPNQSPNVSSDLPTADLPSNSRGLPTPEALSIVLRHAQRLLSGPTISALSRIAGRLDQEGGSTDTTVRGQIHSESVQLGIAMQHLGALLLELGRTILTLHMGQSPAEYFLNAGPAVYISPSGPNPIMVQPFPLQTSSLFGGPAGLPSNPVAPGPVGNGNIPRNVNIHIHTGASLAPIVSNLRSRAPNGEGMQGEHVNGTTSGDSGQTQVLSGRNVIANAFPSRPNVVSVSGAVGGGVSQVPDSGSFSNVISEINSELRRLVANAGNENIAPSGQSEESTGREQSAGSGAGNDDTSCQQMNSSSNGAGETGQTLSGPSMMGNQKTQPQCRQPCNTEEVGGVVNSKSEPSTSFQGGSHNWSSKSDLAVEGATRSNQGKDISDGSSGVPIGLGLGGLHPKRRGRLQKAQSKNNDGATASNQGEQSRTVGQQVLQSLASFSTRGNANTPPLGPSPQPPRGVMESVPTAVQNADGQVDVASSMSNILQSPALDGLLTGVSQQTGVGSPDMLRNMLQQFTQNPAMRSTVNQLAQQIDSHDLGSMFSGLNRGQGGGIDLSTIMQQMMPIVSQALGGVSSVPQPTPPLEPGMYHSRSRRDMAPTQEDSQIELRQVVQRLENQNSAGEIFRSVVDSAVHQYGRGSAELVNELCSEGRLTHEFMQMLSHDISQRLQDETGS